MNQKNISCVISTHNRDEFLKEAIESVIQQNSPPIEIIVSDNVPSQSTKLLIETIAKAGIAAGVDGLFIETHPSPSNAKSDGKNMLDLNKLENLLINLLKIKSAIS